MREEQVRVAARAVVHVLDLFDPEPAELMFRHGAKVEHPTVGDGVVVRERLEHVVAHLVATRPDPGADYRSFTAHAIRGGFDDPLRESTPPAVEHCDGVV